MPTFECPPARSDRPVLSVFTSEGASSVAESLQARLLRCLVCRVPADDKVLRPTATLVPDPRSYCRNGMQSRAIALWRCAQLVNGGSKHALSIADACSSSPICLTSASRGCIRANSSVPGGTGAGQQAVSKALLVDTLDMVCSCPNIPYRFFVV